MLGPSAEEGWRATVKATSVLHYRLAERAEAQGPGWLKPYQPWLLGPQLSTTCPPHPTHTPLIMEIFAVSGDLGWLWCVARQAVWACHGLKWGVARVLTTLARALGSPQQSRVLFGKHP